MKEEDKNTAEWSRRSFLKKSSLMAFATSLGMPIVFGNYIKEGWLPIGDSNSKNLFKDKHLELTILNQKPLNAETPVHLLNDTVTSNDLLFIRNNGIPPEKVDLDKWRLSVEGESVINPTTFSLSELKMRFKHYSYQLTLECGGNGRAEFYPPASGNQWTLGAVGCPVFTGVRLKDVLMAVGIKSDAVYIGYYGADNHLSGDPSREAISRGVPMRKALEEESLIAWEMNGIAYCIIKISS